MPRKELKSPQNENRSLKSFYIKNRKPFCLYLKNIRKISPQKVKSYLSSLDRRLDDIKDVKDLKKNLEKEYTDAYGRALKNLFNFMDYEEMMEFNGISIEYWKKKIKLRPSGVKEIYISDDELREAYEKLDEEYKVLFKLLVYSGMRLTQTLEGIKNIENVVIKDKIARIPISSISKGKKRGFWLYFPSSFLYELKEFKVIHHYWTYQKEIKIGRVSANTIRKWNYNFLIENNVPESIADFIQGRSSTRVGSSHYLNKTVQADREYERIVDKLVNLLA